LLYTTDYYILFLYTVLPPTRNSIFGVRRKNRKGRKNKCMCVCMCVCFWFKGLVVGGRGKVGVANTIMYDNRFRDDTSVPNAIRRASRAGVGTGSRERVERSHSEGMIIQFWGKGSITSVYKTQISAWRLIVVTATHRHGRPVCVSSLTVQQRLRSTRTHNKLDHYITSRAIADSLSPIRFHRFAVSPN